LAFFYSASSTGRPLEVINFQCPITVSGFDFLGGFISLFSGGPGAIKPQLCCVWYVNFAGSLERTHNYVGGTANLCSSCERSIDRWRDSSPAGVNWFHSLVIWLVCLWPRISGVFTVRVPFFSNPNPIPNLNSIMEILWRCADVMVTNFGRTNKTKSKDSGVVQWALEWMELRLRCLLLRLFSRLFVN